ncbi:hypothetical protein [Sphingobium fuliginis]|uniref:hypothetical protein n=1 Tax=Sphingobium fuliginis (strain ATCC 27551) TaxID=336203 RepID=UPI001FCB815F|nr:hypothetical protein [Sphingobium fuliginis]
MIRAVGGDVDLRPYIRSGDGIVISQGTAEPQTLTEALIHQAPEIGSVDIFLGGGSFSKTFSPDRNGGHRLSGYGGVGDHRALIKSGVMELIPAHVSALPRYIGNEIRCDVAMVQVSGPRADGTYSYSLSSDYTVEAVERARTVIAELNHNAPETNCVVGLDPDRIDLLVESERPLLQMPRAPISDLDRAIAARIAEFIDDRSTLQIGYGAVRRRSSRPWPTAGTLVSTPVSSGIRLSISSIRASSPTPSRKYCPASALPVRYGEQTVSTSSFIATRPFC